MECLANSPAYKIGAVREGNGFLKNESNFSSAMFCKPEHHSESKRTPTADQADNSFNILSNYSYFLTCSP